MSEHDDYLRSLEQEIARLEEFRRTLHDADQYWRGMHPEWLTVVDLAELARRAISTLCLIADSHIQTSILRLKAQQTAAQDAHQHGRRHPGIGPAPAGADS
jgi:hypothetical protein